MTAQILITQMINHDFALRGLSKLQYKIAHIGGRYYSDAFHSRI